MRVMREQRERRADSYMSKAGGSYVATGLSEVTDRVVEPNGCDVPYREIGAGAPVICLHGGGPGASGWGNFAQNASAFGRHSGLLVPDPEFGQSTAPGPVASPFATGIRQMNMDSFPEAMPQVMEEIRPAQHFFAVEDCERQLYSLLDIERSADSARIAKRLWAVLEARVERIPVIELSEMKFAAPDIHAVAKCHQGFLGDNR